MDSSSGGTFAALNHPVLETQLIRIWGVVQGVGMRPLVARLARQLDLCGSVSNVGGYLEITVSGQPDVIGQFVNLLYEQKPLSATFIRLKREKTADWRLPGFVIAASRESDGLRFPAPDLAVCPACEAELKVISDRRHDYPFISCMHCGPRYSIMEKLPYDRENTAMDRFPLCPVCETEYTSDLDRRYHAQTIACPDCGPTLAFIRREDLGTSSILNQSSEDALLQTIAAISGGEVIAVKSTGGYHLVCDAANETAVRAIRTIKNREEKPFAVLFDDLSSLSKYAELKEPEIRLLDDPIRPVVLVKPKADVCSSNKSSENVSVLPDLAPSVALASPWLGAMLPSTPIQILLAKSCGPLIMTSANLTGDQLIYKDEDMLAFAESQMLLAGVLTHDRPILTGLDDSVVRWIGRRQILRRARGFVPLAIDIAQETDVGMDSKQLPVASVKTILALGGDLKSTCALAHKGFVWLTQPAGDLAQTSVREAWQIQLQHLQRLLQLQPDRICADLHPSYFSSQMTKMNETNRDVLFVQHHHAHIASVLAEHHVSSPVLGVALDGTGYGPDGTIWGGEFLLCEGPSYQRVAHFKAVPLPGGDAGMREAWRSLAGYLEDAGVESPDWQNSVLSESTEKKTSTFTPEAFKLVRRATRSGINCLGNSSVGRLFDAACALLGLSLDNHYEGECGSLLEWQAQLAMDHHWKAWPLAFDLSVEPGFDQSEQLVIDPAAIFRDMSAVLRNGRDPQTIAELALGFHIALTAAIKMVAQRIRKKMGVNHLALSGGVFQNALLVNQVNEQLSKEGFVLYWNEHVPPHDGGICLGQSWLGLIK